MRQRASNLRSRLAQTTHVHVPGRHGQRGGGHANAGQPGLERVCETVEHQTYVRSLRAHAHAAQQTRHAHAPWRVGACQGAQHSSLLRGLQRSGVSTLSGLGRAPGGVAPGGAHPEPGVAAVRVEDLERHASWGHVPWGFAGRG